MKKIFKNPTIISLLFITLLTLIAQSILIPFLGFYSDDFFFEYLGHFYGSSGIINSLAIDRPLNGYMLGFIYQQLKDHILYWHIGLLLIRLLCGYLVFFSLKKIWPKNIDIITSITLIFLIYPGFLQQTSPLGYITWFIPYAFELFSIMLTIYAIKSGGKTKFISLTFFSVAFQISSFLLLEFLIGCEALRLLLINYSLNKNVRSIKKRIILWMPYVITSILFIVWRIFIYKSVRDITNVDWVIQNYYSDLGWIIRIPTELLIGFIHTFALAYILPFVINIFRVLPKHIVISLVLGGFSGLITFRYFNGLISNTGKDIHINSDKKFGKNLVIIGIISIIGSLLPIVVSGRIVREYLVYDRYTLTSMIGISFIFVGLINMFFKKYRIILLSTLVFLSVTSQLMNGFYRLSNWTDQKNIWWQLYWRSPKIKEDAFIVFDFPRLSESNLKNQVVNCIKWYQIYWVDYQLWAPGNLFFNYNNSPKEHFRGELLSNSNVVDNIKNKKVEFVVDRNLEYPQNYSNLVILSTPSDVSCLWIYDNIRRELPGKSNMIINSVISYSDIDNLVQKDSHSSPPQSIFGKEPEKDWCYYFQKASLARQLKDWTTLSFLTNEVKNNKYHPKDNNEWLPFIEGMIVTKQYTEANDLINTILQSEDHQGTFINNVCDMVVRLKTKTIGIKCL